MANDHDKLVKLVLAEIEIASELFSIAMREEILDLINLNTLRLEDGTYVDDEHREYYSDRLYSVDAKDGEGKFQFFLLLEHKSHPKHSTLDQLAIYQALAYRDQGTEKFPILSVVFYHGKESWNVPLEFHGQIRFPEGSNVKVASEVMNFCYTLVNVGKTRIDELEASFRQKAFWWTLARIWWLDSEENIREFLVHVKEYYENSPDEFVGNLLVYIARVQHIGVEGLEKLVEQTISEGKADTVMATVQQLEENAKLEGKLETAKNLLNRNVSLEIVLESTGLSLEQLKEAGIVK